MKTNELVKHAKALGYEVKNDTYFGLDCLYILNNKKDTVASVKLQQQYDIYTPATFYLESEENQSKLFDLLVEFAKTPIEEREEKKKYYIRLNGVGMPGWNRYLNQLCNREVFFADNRENIEVKSKFTDDEISELPTWVADMLDDGYLVKEEVKDDNEN